MIEIGRTYRHPRTGMEVRVLRNDAAGYEMEVRAGAEMAKGPAHVHQDFDQSFTVVEGRGAMVLDGTERTLEPGDTVDVPRGRAHADVWNAGPGPLVVRNALSPNPPFIQAYAETVIANLQDGRLPDSGDLPPLHLAVVQAATGARSYLTGVPIALQRVLIPVLAAIGRARGLRVETLNPQGG